MHGPGISHVGDEGVGRPAKENEKIELSISMVPMDIPSISMLGSFWFYL